MSKKEIAAGLIIAVIIAMFLSPLASSLPDGLERVAQDYGFSEKSEKSPVWRAPLPDYIFPGLKNERAATSISGFLGTVIIFAVVYSLGLLLKKRKDR
jgi:cobalt/nickel transport protein